LIPLFEAASRWVPFALECGRILVIIHCFKISE